MSCEVFEAVGAVGMAEASRVANLPVADVVQRRRLRQAGVKPVRRLINSAHVTL